MKKLISIILMLTMVLSVSISAGAVEYGEELKNQPSKTYMQKFSDVPEDFWAFSYIGEMEERGVLNGYPDGKFYPDSQVTRAEFAKIMTMAAGLKIEQPTMQIFNDVAVNEWYAPYIHTAKSYLSAYNQNGGSYYLPDMPALREDIAVAMVKLKGYSVVGADITMLARMFSDYQSISSEAQKYVASAVENGLISGYDDGTFRGQQSITRAEAATLLWRAYQYGNNNKTYDDTTPTQTPSQVTEQPAEPTQTPINEPEETAKPEEPQSTDTPEEKKPYIMKTLASINISQQFNSSSQTSGGLTWATIDNDKNIYYIDASDSCIYRINIENGSNMKYFDPTELILEKPAEQENEESSAVAEYSSYVPVQVYYDNVNNKILLIGYYDTITEAFKTPEQDQIYNVIYDITNGTANVFSDIGNTEYGRASVRFGAVLSSQKAQLRLNSWHYRGVDLDITSGEARINNGVGDEVLKTGSDLFCLTNNSLNKYDFNESDYIEIATGLEFDSYASKGDSYYFWNSDGSIYKISVQTGKTTTLDISTKSDNVEFADMGNMNNIDERFLVVDDDTMIFYDLDMGALRILEKNI